MRVEDKLVGRKEQTTHGAFDALGPRGVVSRRQERPSATPGALVVHGKREVVGQTWGSVVAEEALAETLGLATCDHPTASRRNRHGSGPPEDL